MLRFLQNLRLALSASPLHPSGAASGKHPKAAVTLGLLFAFLIIYQPPALAQNASGSLHGTVADSTGAVVPNAQVELKNQANGETRSTVSNGSGFFNFAAVPPATYTVKVSAPGFTSWEERDIESNQGANITLPNITLQVGTSKQEIEVVSGADVVVPTDTGQVSQTLNEHMITELAIQGRDAAELIKIMPGMGMNTGLGQSQWTSLTTSSNNGPIGNFSAQGTQPNGGMTMTSDGANLLDPGNQGTQTSNINQNQIQEFSIMTSAYGAEYAKGPVTFQAIGKSGGTLFHGGAYLYARNGDFNSTDSYLKATGVAPPQDSYYYPGGDFGGPVLIPKTNFNHNHDKLFFYGAYEYMKQQPAGSLIQRFIPTQQMMNGNFSPEYLKSLGPNFANYYSSNVTPPCASGCTNNVNLPGGIIPASLLDPNSAALYKTMPKPNIDPATSAVGANYQYLVNPPVNRWEVRLRGDYNLSEKTKVFFSWNRQDETDNNPISVWWATGNAIPYPSAMPAKQVSQVYSANVTHVFTPTLTNEFVFADATFLNPISLTNPAAVDPGKIGFNITGLFKNSFTPQIPNTISWSNSVPGYFAPTFGQKFSGGVFGKLSQTPSISDNLSKVAGTHTLKFGFYWDFARNQQAGSDFSNPPQGALDFENYGSNSSKNPLADFAMGRITGFTQESGTPVADFKYHQYSFYANDQWKTTRRLTLTFGLRFDHMGSWYPSSGPGLAVWDQSAYNNTSSAGAFTGLAWHAINSKIPISGLPSRSFFYEPRFGVAYDVFGTGKTVVRGGFGVYRYQLAYNSVSGAAFNAPLGFVTEGTTWNCCIGYGSFNQFSPSLGPAGLGSSLSGVLKKGDDRTPYTESYNFTISQRVPWKSVVEISYSGNQSHDLLLRSGLSDINQIPLGAFFGPDPTTGIVQRPTNPDGSSNSNFNSNHYFPLKNYTSIPLVSHGSYQYYNGLIVSWQKQTGRTTFTTNYTFSKVLGVRDGETDNGGGNGTLVNPYSLRANYGVLSYDHTHIFNAAYVINLPDPIHGNKLLAGVANGWQFSGITQMQSGAPIQPNTNGNLNAQWSSNYSAQNYLGSNTAGLSVMPALVCDPRSNLRSGYYFNPSCFAAPTGGQNGPSVWPYIKGPAFFNSDLSLFKNFAISERQKVQLRFEAFNFLNHPLPQFGASGNNDISLNFNNGPTNGNATTSGKPLFTVGRRVIEFAVKYNF